MRQVAYTAEQSTLYENKLSKALIIRLCIYQVNAHFPVTMRLGDTPVLIPNTMVKT